MKLKFNLIFLVGILISLQVPAQKKKVACVGDSITYGLGLSNPSTESYPGQMQVLLGTTSWQLGNFGDSARLLQKKGYSYWNSGQYTNALAFNPDLVVIALGTNDAYPWALDGSDANFRNDYKALIQSFQILSTKPEVSICLIAPAENSSWGLSNSYIDKVNVDIKQVAIENGVNLIDLHTAFDGHWPSWFQSDAVHPSVTGAGLIAQKVQEMLLMPKPEVSYANGKITAPDGDGYQWYKDGVAVASVDGGNLKEMTIIETGIYKVSIKLNAGNETRIVSKELNLLVLSKIDYKIKSKKVVVFPNPVCEVISVILDNQSENVRYTISDLSGKTVSSGLINNDHNAVNVSKFSAGIYMLKIGSESIKIVKR
ncbi:MAG: SGNH/GDSL hydrolase family protein [Flavobacterium sp.]|uniref:SGNH/GDSL hydrolase family protein n=1 Tax=Flavobacterium sp. TaxID=239 RepID=UPI00260837D6|nr:SGNH/GDSL hydrolase family protein [Flavobacterium sp.]MDD5148875.1 SGNH/GDSL hydrolase family protein [Flavobacterium sp.]